MTIENLKIKSLLQLIIEQRVKININVFVRHENHLKKKEIYVRIVQGDKRIVCALCECE